MLNEVYVQTTPIPNDLRPPVEMEVIAYAVDAKKDPFRAFLDGEKERFDLWTDHLPLSMIDFVQAYEGERIFLLVSKVPDDPECALFKQVQYLLDDVQNGPMLGGIGVEIDGVSMAKRARWVVTKTGLKQPTKSSLLGPDKPPYLKLRLLLFCFCASLTALLFYILTR